MRWFEGVTNYISKNGSNTLVIATAETNDGIVVKFFPETTHLVKVDHYQGFLNQCKIDGMLHDNSSCCNSK